MYSIYDQFFDGVVIYDREKDIKVGGGHMYTNYIPKMPFPETHYGEYFVSSIQPLIFEKDNYFKIDSLPVSLEVKEKLSKLKPEDNQILLLYKFN